MSQRETQISGSLQQWKGVDQRSQPTLVQDGFFMMSKGMLFGFGDNVERMPGKRLSTKMDDAIVSIVQFGRIAFLQTLASGVWMVPIEELVLFDIILQPGMPDAPTLSNVQSFSIDATMPAAFPANTLSFSLQRSLDDAIWTTVATGLAPLQLFSDTGLSDDTQYYYRLLAVGVGAETAGPSDTATTPARLPDAPASPNYSSITATSFDVNVSALAAFADDMDLERSPDDATWSTEATGLLGGEVIPYTGETTGVPVYFRLIGNNVHGSTAGASSFVIPDAAGGDARITESGDIRITETGGDFRVIQ